MLPAKGFIRNVTVLAGGTLVAQIITIIFSPLLTRLFTPDEFGVFSIYNSILGIIAPVASLRYMRAIVLPEDDKVSFNVLILSIIVIVISTSLVGLSILGIHVLRTGSGTLALGWLLWLLPLGVLVRGIYRAITFWAIRKKRFYHITKTKVSQYLSRSLTQVGFGLFSSGSGGLVIGVLVGFIAGILTFIKLDWHKDRSLRTAVDLGQISQSAKRYRRFPIFSSWAALINSAGLRTPNLVLAAVYGVQVAGWFSLTERIVAIPITLISQSVANVYLGEAPELARRDPKSLRKFLLRAVLRLFAIGSILIILISLGAPLLFSLLFGEGWREAGVYMQLLSIMFIIQFSISPLSSTLVVLEQQGLWLIWNVGRLILGTGSLLVASQINLAPVEAIGVYSLGTSISYVALFMMSFLAIQRRENSEKEKIIQIMIDNEQMP